MRSATGPLLSIDLDEQTAETESIDDVLDAFVGGRGVGTKLAYDRVPFDADPLGSENRLTFAAGPLQTARTSFTGRMNCTGLSPLTDGILSSNAGGFLSRNAVATGYSAVEIAGESDELLIVHVSDTGVGFEPVPELAGAAVSAVSEHVVGRGLDASHVACIGPAGENLVRFASIMTSESRTFGRGGLGAVLGSKNVKAITFSGDSAPETEFPAVASDIHRDAAESDHVMKRQGTASLTEFASQVGALPTHYYSELEFEGSDGISGDRVEEKKFRKGTCSACAFACKLPTRDEASGLETEGPEFETVMAFGSNCGIDEITSVMKSNDLCDELGMDTISCGATVAAYLESEDAFGDAELVHALVEKIARREGMGDVLAEGIDRIHDELGVENWSSKGMPFAAHDGRALNGQGLAFATSNRGADHLYGGLYTYEYPLVEKSEALDPEGMAGKPEKLVASENHNALLDSAICCKFSRTVLTDKRLATLLDAEYERLLETGARIVALERRFNNERGFDRSDDDLPYELPGFEDALDEYYRLRDWNPDGTVP
ncbi:aldehyde ferredoxin oxidoreductase family protein [Halalkalicoccus subterraneus]|uniref:aldehyde ferredoxin oxidoreductase family protein n=1 Tax=Halalkalicoccus subterraneus TaxID=2675002 RepID=UPI000EFD9C2B|nr:aldehyde ferredoxin oxidoreductase C-terminal domain-containing protein [Halalkalicoccus subterraneus]